MDDKTKSQNDIDEIIADNFFIATQAVKEMSASDDKKDGD
jgi:hypothetical protein